MAPGPAKGTRPSGRQKGTPNRRTIEAALEAEYEVVKARGSNKKLAKEVLDEFMHLFAGMAATYQPTPPGETPDPRRSPNEEQFEKYARLAVDCAKSLAPYQSPTFRAIMVAPAPDVPGDSGKARRRISLTIFEGPRPRIAPPTTVIKQ